MFSSVMAYDEIEIAPMKTQSLSRVFSLKCLKHRTSARLSAEFPLYCESPNHESEDRR